MPWIGMVWAAATPSWGFASLRVRDMRQMASGAGGKQHRSHGEHREPATDKRHVVNSQPATPLLDQSLVR